MLVDGTDELEKLLLEGRHCGKYNKTPVSQSNGAEMTPRAMG
jgi:hypothetical protein